MTIQYNAGSGVGGVVERVRGGGGGGGVGQDLLQQLVDWPHPVNHTHS